MSTADLTLAERRQSERRSTSDQLTTREHEIVAAAQTLIDADPDGPMAPGLALAVRMVHAAVALGVDAR